MYENCFLLTVGFGQTTIDCIIASFYILTDAQFLMMRNHLENITDLGCDKNGNEIICKQKHKNQYLDDNEFIAIKLHEKLVYNVKKFEKIHWYATILLRYQNNTVRKASHWIRVFSK